MARTMAVAVAVASALTACWCPLAPDAPAAEPGAPPRAAARVPGEYLVTLASGADASAIREVYGALGVDRVRPVRRNVYLVSIAEDPGPVRMEELRKRDARIAAVQPNFVYRP